jgi:tRNA threonylcarbamoyladenosine modification (KEOPS) complex Cgi121 subunit
MRKLTTEEFIRKAREKHSGGYDYEKTVYINNRTKVLITCQTCDEDFLQTPSDHLTGRGCSGCKFKKMKEIAQNMRKKSANTFTTKAIKVHGEKYTYDKVNYVNNITRVSITCLACCHDFEQIPRNHLSGAGCPKCAIRENGDKYRKTTQQFIKDAIKVHGDKYGYENVIYVNSKTKVSITCLVCNKDFPQIPSNHLIGNGCPRCKFKKMNEANEIARKRAVCTFVKKATKVHGNKYGYEKTKYIDAKTKVTITCLSCCKDFEQRPNCHLTGRGCNDCGNRRIADKFTKTTQQFIKDAIKVHGDKYGYENVVYTCARARVQITCLKCKSDFTQKADSHLCGNGCPKCVNKTEEIVASKLHEILGPLGFEVEQTGRCVFDGIGRMDITITKEDLVIFVEVDGLQHFEYVKQFRSEAIDVQERDLEKHMRAIERGHKVIRIDQEWVWKSHMKNKTEWASRLCDTIMKPEASIDEMFLSDKSDKYHDHLCYRHCKT